MLDLIQKTSKQDEELLTNIDLLKGAACGIQDTVKKLLDTGGSDPDPLMDYILLFE